jgi:sugar fermentation stimulation protein A
LEKQMPLQQQFPSPLIRANLLRRYKRFLADVELEDGEQLTVHCPNTGAMTGCAEPGCTVWLSISDSKTRKYPHTWELVETAHGMACIHSARANQVVAEAVAVGKIAVLAGYPSLQREVKYGTGSRADLVLDGDGRRCVVEVKSVTLRLADGVGAFPDAVSERARKHLTELQSVVEAGDRAVIFFCVFHEGIRQVVPAHDIDPAYCRALAAALAAGVEAMAWAASITPEGISLDREIPFLPD